MADMCGPSNALSSFQKHSTVDRTLQQDRLVARHPSTQGFRSAPGPNAHQLDHEFEAFQAGNLPLDHAFQQHRQGLPQQGFQGGLGSTNWATDFQKMNISSPPPQHFQQSYGGQVQQRHDTGGWHQDFARQQSQISGPSLAQSTQQTGYMQQYHTMSGGLGIGMGQLNGGFTGSQQEQQNQQHLQERFDEEAFAKAFDEAAKAEQEQHQAMELGQDIMIEESAERLMSTETDLSRPIDQAPIGADTIHDPTKPMNQQPREDPDALARTAGRLLDSVAHDESEKFKGSMFMELMRQFRDGDLGVKGEEVVDREGRATEVADAEMTDEDLKTRISDITYTLKKVLLDRDRPFIRTPTHVRRLLLTLLQLNEAIQNSGGAVLERVVQRTRLSRTLKAIIASPSLNGLPSIRILAIDTWKTLRNVLSSNEGLEGDGSDFVTDSTVKVDESYLNAATREARIEGDEEYYWPSDAGPGVVHADKGYGKLERGFIARALLKGVQNPSGSFWLDKDVMEFLLGYEIMPMEDGGDSWKVHELRMEDILGPSIRQVMEALRRKGLFNSRMKTMEFFELVNMFREETGGRDGRHFVTALETLEALSERS